ncbi:MAG: ATP-dependent DNA ligase [Synechococcus sp.]|nr:ATP-dependent DNA ligase [Synechococcus sp.]
MEQFAHLIDALDGSSGSKRKVDLLRRYFAEVAPEDGCWALSLLLGERRQRLITGRRLREILQSSTTLPDWLFDDCHSHVGDSAETVALLWPQLQDQLDDPSGLTDPVLTPLLERIPSSPALHWWMEALLPKLASGDSVQQAKAMTALWRAVPDQRHFLLNKLLTGGFRIGVARGLVVKAIAAAFSLEETTVLERLMGGVKTTAVWFRELSAPFDQARTDRGAVPYPFFLASPLQRDAISESAPEQWWIESKWDGIRGQLIRRQEDVFLWSRGEELINSSFPELVAMAEQLPVNTVLDGEVICWQQNQPRPLPFASLQRRLGRKRVGAKLRQECPVQFVAYDLLEDRAMDLRDRPLSERLTQLQSHCQHLNGPESWRLQLSAGQVLNAWDELDELRDQAGARGAEGLMLKQLQSPYLAGRKRGYWWKHKLEPMTLDVVLIYAQAGTGRRANLFTDYTFALWDRSEQDPNSHQLVTFAKAYSGLNDEEILTLDRWIRRHTRERFGPTRVVEPELVFEIGFEGIQRSKRHKCGLAVRFPRILRWRHDRSAASADSLNSAESLLLQRQQTGP